MTVDSIVKSSPISSVKLTANALRVLEKRYLKKDGLGNVVETPEDMFHRVAATIAAAELIYDPQADVLAKQEEFYSLMANLEFLPNSPTLLNAGRELGQLASCFVVPIKDSVEDIFSAVKHTALIQQSGGGTGFSFSRIRPSENLIESKGKTISGPVAFMFPFSTTADVIKQGGVRRGCNIGLLNVNHPDILAFIKAKDDPLALTNFCIAVAVTDEFMEAVKTGADYDLIDPHTNSVVGRLNAKEVLDQISLQSWKTGDPGIVFSDRINQYDPTPHLGMFESVSGCAEQPLHPYESCVLGSINLTKMIVTTNGVTEIDYLKLAKTVEVAVNFLDNVIDVNKYPLYETEEMTKKTRKIGLGVMGFADMLIQIGVSYASDEALEIASNLMCFISEEAHKSSEALAEKRGVFPAFNGSKYDIPGGSRLRNAACTTIAPTGTISLIAGCSHSIEPNYAMVFVRNVMEGEQLLEVNHFFKEIAKKEGFYSEGLLKKLVTNNGFKELECIPDRIKQLLSTTHSVKPERHVKMQAAFQKHVDNGVSKMINLPKDATKEDVSDLFILAYEQGLKGTTCYRDKSRKLQSLSTNEVGVQLVDKYLLEEVTKKNKGGSCE